MLEQDSKIQPEPVPRSQLYGEICACRFDSVTLHHIDSEYYEIQNGKRTFGRYDFPERDSDIFSKLLQETLRKDQKLAKACILCRADETAGTKQPRGSFEAEKECGLRQERILEEYARATDDWIDLRDLDPQYMIGSGGESEVYHNPYDTSSVIKINTTVYTVSPQMLLDRICIHNALFPTTKMTIEGFGRNELGDFCIVYTQPFIKGTSPAHEEIESLLEGIGPDVRLYHGAGNNYKNGLLLFDDFHDQNVIKDADGNLHVIDTDLMFNIPERGKGGTLRIPPVTEDFKIDKAMKNVKNENNIEIEGMADWCSSTKDEKTGKTVSRMTVMTASAKDNEGNREWTRHRVVAVTEGRKGSQLENFSAACTKKMNLGAKSPALLPPTPLPVSIKGYISTDENNEPFVMANHDGLTINKTAKNGNRADIKGTVMATTANDAYASIILEVEAREKKILLPIIISAKDNTGKYKEICAGRLFKGDEIKLSGPLKSKTYSDGEKRQFRCSVNAADYIILKRAERRTKGHKKERSI